MKLVILLSASCALLFALARPARAQTPTAGTQPSTTRVQANQPDYFGNKQVSQKVSFRQAKPRTHKQHMILAGLFGGALAFGGVGLYFHLDSRDATDKLQIATLEPTLTYDRTVDSTRDRAFRSRTVAIVGYSIAGAFLAATVVALAMTQPGDEIVTVDDAAEPKTVVPVSIAPTRGGAMVGKAWSF